MQRFSTPSSPLKQADICKLVSPVVAAMYGLFVAGTRLLSPVLLPLPLLQRLLLPLLPYCQHFQLFKCDLVWVVLESDLYPRDRR